MCVCVRACVRACVRVCVRTCVCVCVLGGTGGGVQCLMTNVCMLISCVLISVFCLFGWLVGVCLFVFNLSMKYTCLRLEKGHSKTPLLLLLLLSRRWRLPK